MLNFIADIIIIFFLIEDSSGQRTVDSGNRCEAVCQDLPGDDMELVCMMLSRYKQGYEFFVNLSLARQTICRENLVNYIFSKVSKFSTIFNCESDNSTVFEQYILSSYDWFFGMGVPYSLPIGIFLHIVTMVASLNFSYCQLFVICVSLYLTSILKELNKKILSLDCKYVSSSYWRTLRQDYNRATRLVRAFDNVIKNIVLASFARNLFIVCLQLYFVLRSLRNYDQIITHIYLVYSTIFVIIRSISVSLFAARIHSTSLKVVPILYSVPPPTHCIEIQRFIDQTHGNTVALSGQHFFYVTKEVILYMIGTIVTYELVLFQLK